MGLIRSSRSSTTPRLQVLHLRDLVGPTGLSPRDRDKGRTDPDAGPHGRELNPVVHADVSSPATVRELDRGRRSPPSCRSPFARSVTSVGWQQPVVARKPVGEEGLLFSRYFVETRPRVPCFEPPSSTCSLEPYAAHWRRCPNSELDLIELPAGLTVKRPLQRLRRSGARST